MAPDILTDCSFPCRHFTSNWKINDISILVKLDHYDDKEIESFSNENFLFNIINVYFFLKTFQETQQSEHFKEFKQKIDDSPKSIGRDKEKQLQYLIDLFCEKCSQYVNIDANTIDVKYVMDIVKCSIRVFIVSNA